MQPWLIESLRLTTFHDKVFDLRRDVWWPEIAGVEAEISNIAGPQRQEVGSYSKGKLINVTAANKVDWVLAAVPDVTQGQTAAFQEMWNVDEIIAEFDKVSDAWLSNERGTNRLALGVSAVINTGGKAESYTALQEFLPTVKLDPIGSSDLMYRINRPRSVSVPGPDEILVNRLSTWSCKKLSLTMHFGDGAGAVIGAASPAIEVHRACCELDLSTSGDRTDPMSSAALKQAWAIMVALAVEILQEGDVP